MTTERRQRLAGVVLLFGLVYIVFEFISAGAWISPPYDWAKNFISDLGFSDCAVIDGDRICSPLHPLMNAGFMVQGTVFTVGSLLVVRIMLDRRWERITVGTLLVASGAGTFFVGVFHQSLALYEAGLNGLHILAATLAIGPGNAGILLLGLCALRHVEWRGYAIVVSLLGIFGLVSSVLLVTETDFGLGLGLVERLAVYPLNAWTIGTGVGLLVKGVRDRMRAAAAARALTSSSN